MGLRDLFRSGKSTTPTPEPSHGERPADPTPQRGAEEQERVSAQPGAGGDGVSGRGPEPTAQALPDGGPLRHLVELLLSRGADRAQLTLVQSGNIMTHQTRQAVGDSPDEVENGTVDQGSPMFDDVADLYTEAMSAPTGPWRQLDLAVGAPQDGRRDVVVTYDFPSGESRTERYSHGRTADTPQEHSAESPGAGQPHAPGTSEAVEAGQPGTGTADAAAAGDGSAQQDLHHGAEAQPVAGEQAADGGVRLVDEHRAQEAADGDLVAGGQPAPVVVGGAARTAEPGMAQDDAPFAPRTERGAEPGDHGQLSDEQVSAEAGASTGGAAEPAPAEETRAAGVSFSDATAPTPEPSQGGGAEDGHELPAHVDESVFGTDAPETLVPAVGSAGAGDDLSDAPQLATATDVSPSYQAPAPAQEADPDALATGNLVLSVRDVTARLADAQRHLFGPEGTARDVSTVLIRVRALGTYSDALTHVRLNGFWDQRPTFDLVPEDQLGVQELKDDSYVEGSGAPLAMMFRFRPGVPPEVAFDYSDEEAFVRYEQRLPGQNYLEELRMYPRTGSNIPQHVNDALQDWNY